MKYTFIKPLACAALLGAVLTGCINNDDYGTPQSQLPQNCVEPAVVVNKTVAEVVATATAPIKRDTINDNVIEAYVVSNDERGNFFKSISLQTLVRDGSAPVGFSVSIDRGTLFGDGFYPGRKVYVRMKKLDYAKLYGSMIVGQKYVTNGLDSLDAQASFAVGRISEYRYKNYIKPSCSEVSEDQLVRPMSITQAKNDANLNTLIDLQNVQFIDDNVGDPYYDEADVHNTAGGSTNKFLTDLQGSSMIFRTSSFASFAGSKISGKSGTVRGVLTKYGNDYQFIARAEEDVKLTGTRFDAAPPIVGNNITYADTFSENFESYTTVNNQVFPREINDAASGNTYWQVKSFSGNRYIQMSAYNDPSASNRALFIVPVHFTGSSALSFQSKDGYNDGDVLKVYYSTDYTPGGDINDATLVDITSNFAIATGSTSAYALNFTNSGAFTIPVTGNGFVIFEYKGSDANGPTTTMQLENIVIN